MILGNFRESQRELQRWFSRQQQEHLGKQQIPEDAENEREDDLETNYSGSCEKVRANHLLNEEDNSISTALEDVKLKMLQQNDTPQNYPPIPASQNQTSPSISVPSNLEHQRYG